MTSHDILIDICYYLFMSTFVKATREARNLYEDGYSLSDAIDLLSYFSPELSPDDILDILEEIYERER